MKVNQYASDMVQWAEDMLVYLDQTSDAQIKADGRSSKDTQLCEWKSLCRKYAGHERQDD